MAHVASIPSLWIQRRVIEKLHSCVVLLRSIHWLLHMTGKAINLMRVQLRAHSVTYMEEKGTVRGSVNETL